MDFCAGSLIGGEVVNVLSSCTIISLRKRELITLCFLDIMCRLVFCISSSWCHGLVCGMRLWHFVVIITCFMGCLPFLDLQFIIVSLGAKEMG